jgi:hypothetical protein
MSMLTSVRKSRGKHVQAEEIFHRILEINRRTKGEEDPTR